MNRNPNAFLKDEYEDLVKKNFDWKLRILETGSKPHSNANLGATGKGENDHGRHASNIFRTTGRRTQRISRYSKNPFVFMRSQASVETSDSLAPCSLARVSICLLCSGGVRISV